MDDATLQQALPDVCASYQGAVINQLCGKTKHILETNSYASLGLSGGVANNKMLGAAMQRLAARYTIPCYIAEPNHTGDNAAMIAFAAWIDPDSTSRSSISIEPGLRLELSR